MGSDQTRVLSAVSECFDFAKSKTVQNVIQYIRERNIEIDDRNLQGLVGIIEQSVSQALVLSSGNIEKTLSTILENK